MIEETPVEAPVVPTATPEEAPAPQEPSQQSPVQAELENIEKGKKRTPLEKLLYTRKRVDEQIAELTGEEPPVEDEDRPLTVRDLQRIEAEKAKATALSMANGVEDEAERKLVIHHLENTIRPSGDAATDFRNAQLLVNAVKTSQTLQEVARTRPPRANGSAPSAPPRTVKDEELTPEEVTVMNGFGLSKEEVIKARTT